MTLQRPRARVRLVVFLAVALMSGGLSAHAAPVEAPALRTCLERFAGDPLGLAICGRRTQTVSASPATAADDACVQVDTVSDACPRWVATYDHGNNFGSGYLGSSPDEHVTATLLSRDGERLFVAGKSLDQSTSDAGVAVLAYDPDDGQRLWEFRHDTPGPDAPIGLIEAAGGRLFVTASSRRPGSSADDAVVLALDPATGQTVWQWRWHGGDGSSKPAGLFASPDGRRLYLGATTASGGATATSDYAVIAYDLVDEKELWDFRYDGGLNDFDGLNEMLASPDGNTLYLTGQSKAAGGFYDYDIATLALDASTGTVRWTDRRDGGERSIDAGNRLAISPDGSGLFVAGIHGRPGIGPSLLGPSAFLISDYAVLAYDAATGASTWSRRYRGPTPPIGGLNVPADVAVDDRGEQVYVTGISSGAVEYDLDAATVAFRIEDGAQDWAARYALPGHNYEYGAALEYEPEEDRIYVTGGSATIAFTQFGIGRQGRYVTIAYDAGNGNQVWASRYGIHDDPQRAADFDAAAATAVDRERRRVFVAGTIGQRRFSTINEERYWFDFGTVAYDLPGAGRARVTPGGFASQNLEWVAHIPTNSDSAGAKIVGDYLYLTTSQHLKIYDISDPLLPTLVSVLPVPAEELPYFSEEDPDTNGRILLFGSRVIDVNDKSNPRIIGDYVANNHTMTCVLDCTWAYGSGGAIIDLRDPANARQAGTWGFGSHDVTEVAPGLVLTSSNPIRLLDARENPAKPTVIAQGPLESVFNHSNLWPHQATDRFLLVGGETGPSTNCSASLSGTLRTYDATEWEQTGTFTRIHSWAPRNGLPTNGEAPANLFCAHWFDTHPRYRNGGLVAMAYYEHGVRLLRISDEGKIREVGYHVLLGGSTSAAYWVTDDIIYSVDYHRGLDILRYTGRP